MATEFSHQFSRHKLVLKIWRRIKAKREARLYTQKKIWIVVNVTMRFRKAVYKITGAKSIEAR